MENNQGGGALKFGKPGANQAAEKKAPQRESKSETPTVESQEAPFAVTYSSHPIPRFSVGNFHFVKSRLTLTDPAKVEEFDKLLAAHPPLIRNKVKKLDPEAAAALIEAHRKSGSVTGIDTTANTIGPKPAGEGEGEGDKA